MRPRGRGSGPDRAGQVRSGGVPDAARHQACGQGRRRAREADAAFAKLATSPPDRQGAAGELEGAAGDLEGAVKSRLLTSTQAGPLLTGIANAARLLVDDAVADARARSGANTTRIDAALAAQAAGDARLAAGRFKDAVARYKDAVAKADGA